MKAEILVPAAGTIIVALISLISAWLAVRASKSQKQIEQRAADRAGLDKYYDQLNEDMERRIKALTDESEAMRGRVKMLEDDAELLKVERSRDRAAIDALAGYARTLMQQLRDAGVTVPTIPVELRDYGYDGELRRMQRHSNYGGVGNGGSSI